MKQADPAVQDLARQLLAQESYAEGQEEAVQAALRAFEKMRLHLSKLVGVAGFQALFLRALILAKAKVRWLETVQVQSDGALEGFGESAQKQDTEMVAKGSSSLMEQLLGLLIILIGDVLTLYLVQDIWPEARLDTMNSGAEERPA